MTQQEIFKNARLIEFPENPVSVIANKNFFVSKKVKSAELFVVGFGFFEARINGILVSEDRFLPLNTDFHEREMTRKYGKFNEVTAHRVYVPSYRVENLLVSGENNIDFFIGNGWYACDYQEKFGTKKLIFLLEIEYEDNKKEFFVSDKNVKYKAGYITQYILTKGEIQDFTEFSDNEKGTKNCVEVKGLADINYMKTDCPADRTVEKIAPVLIKECDGRKVYDIGKNCSGNVVLLIPADKGKEITVKFSEDKTKDNEIDESLCWEQSVKFICSENEREVSQRFTWHAGRYFSVEGECEVLRFDVIHTDTKITSRFCCDYENINWIYDAFINTQLSNMHSGIPSDCPHIERRGYTGDGELTAEACMYTLSMREFYSKWIGDISDCQDRISGHVQYTAPYTHSGGGPGGWGGAIVHVPFLYYKMYGEITYMRDMYSQMKHYFKFLDEHSEDLLVVSDVPDEWCLGDWCTPDEIKIPAPFVNTYFYIKAINEILSVKDKLSLEEKDIKELEEKKKALSQSIISHYYNEITGDFAENIQGANAFAVDIGLGNEKTLNNIIENYKGENPSFDTGIFGTDILTRVLFENGCADIAFNLLNSEGEFSFGNIKNQGATTLYEYWTGRRSHSHPMFGAVTAYLFKHILGITQKTDSFGFEKIVISPADIKKEGNFFGKITVLQGEISVRISYKKDSAQFEIDVPCDAEFNFKNNKTALSEGKNIIKVNY